MRSLHVRSSTAVYRLLAIAFLLAGCRPGYTRVRTVDEMEWGTCRQQKLEAGEHCEKGARDYSAGLTMTAPRGRTSELGGQAWFRWPLFDTSLDVRRMQRGTRSYHSAAGGIGTHLRPMYFWPHVQRYLDLVVNAGFELGGVVEEEVLRGRGDGYVGLAIDVFAPDIGELKYLETGVPGLRIGARQTWYVQGWNSDLMFELGLIWRWGEPIDLYHHWTYHRNGD